MVNGTAWVSVNDSFGVCSDCCIKLTEGLYYNEELGETLFLSNFFNRALYCTICLSINRYRYRMIVQPFWIMEECMKTGTNGRKEGGINGCGPYRHDHM